LLPSDVWGGLHFADEGTAEVMAWWKHTLWV
jgi:hypothetical protein